MIEIKNIIKMWDKGITEPHEIIVFVISTVVLSVSSFIKINKFIALNEFDSLLIPKHEKNIQQLLVKIKDYLTFCLIYFFLGLLLSFVLNSNILGGPIGLIFISIVLIAFVISYLLLILKVIISEFLKNYDWKVLIYIEKRYRKKNSNLIIFTNLYLSFIVYSLLLGNPFLDYSDFNIYYFLILIISPIALLYTYRIFTNKYLYEYVCQVITEAEFNAALPIVKYSLDKDRMVFSTKIDVDTELLIFDRNCSKYFKFTKIEIL